MKMTKTRTMAFKYLPKRLLLRVLTVSWITAIFLLWKYLIFNQSENAAVNSRQWKETDCLHSALRLRNESEMRLVTAADGNTIVELCSLKAGLPTIQERCGQLKYDALGRLPKTSVIITFHDSETVASLVRTIHSVVQRTPDELLQEIIVIDDFSQKDDLGEVLAIYIQNTFSDKVKLIRNSENLGLIGSRLKGARMSQGGVLFFMDSHSEVLPGWLEPLLFEIKKNRRTLVTSVIDWISKDDGQWTYRQACTEVTVIFDYSMGFGWDFLTQREQSNRNVTDPIRTKSIIGAYCAIDKQFFKEIGELDEGMKFWGGENIELPLRVWLFDGQVVTAPCSRVAHLEGKDTRAYRSAFRTVIRKNYKRLAEVWFDDYKECFYHYFEDLRTTDVGDLTDRLRVKKNASHDFAWYLQNIFPSLGCPVLDSFAWGPLTNLGTGQCIDIIDGSNLHTSQCHPDSHAQRVYWSRLFHFREPNYIWLVNFVKDSTSQTVYKNSYLHSYENEKATKFVHWKDGPLIEVETRLCLEAPPDTTGTVKLQPCSFPQNSKQSWRFTQYAEEYYKLVRNESTYLHGPVRDFLFKAMANFSFVPAAGK